MNEIKLGELKLGDQLEEAVFSKDGNLLLNKGTVVSYEILSKLKNHDVDFYNTITRISGEHQPENVLNTRDYEKSVETVKRVFEKVLSQDQTGIKGKIPDDQVDMVVGVVEVMLKEINSREELLYSMTKLMDTDDYTYKHSVNVSILSILTAKAMDFSDEEIKEIAIGALLHDIGKAKVGSEVIQKPSALKGNEREEMRKHPEYGYEIVKDVEGLPYSVKQIVRHHHEKLDGTGYPMGLKGMEIPKYVRLVTVCDMYDAMTTNRIYRKRMPVYTALEILMKDAVYKIDREVYRKMTSTICVFPVGVGVILSDGRVGIVSSYTHQNPTRPKVKVIDFTIGQSEIDVEEINLERHHTLFIVDVWDVDAFKSQFDGDSFDKMTAEEKGKYASSVI